MKNADENTLNNRPENPPAGGPETEGVLEKNAPEKAVFSAAAVLEEQENVFATFYALLTEKNKVMNLTAITEKDEVRVKHFEDSLMLLSYDRDFETLIDVGTGAGFPGVPLAIARPDVRVLLLDSLRKRIGFLDEVCAALPLPNAATEHNRAEDAVKTHRETFDRAVSRAVANLSTLSEYCLPFVKVGGYFVAYKSGNVAEEVEAAQNAVRRLGGEIERIETYRLSNGDPRSLIFIRKIAPTPKKYPRKAGTPQKDPLR